MHQIFNPKLKTCSQFYLKKCYTSSPLNLPKWECLPMPRGVASLKLYNNQDDKFKIKWLDCFEFKVFKVKKAKLEN